MQESESLNEKPKMTTAQKSAAASERIFNAMRDMAYLTEAIDSSDMGDPSELDDIYTSIYNLHTYLREPEMRIRPVKESGILKLCHATLSSLENNNINSEKLQDEWGKCYATFLTSYERQQVTKDRDVYASTLISDTAANVNKVPHQVGRDGFIITHLPIIFTTHASILSKLKRFPANFNATQWVGGYLFQNQLIVGVEAEGKQQSAVVAAINAIINAYKAEGTPMVNVLAGRKYCYFWHPGNPLAFAWLMPENVYSQNPLHVNNVKINVRSSGTEGVTPELTIDEKLKKNKKDRELFETFLNCDKEYSALMEKVSIDKRLHDVKSTTQHLAKANRRKEALRLQWVKGIDADPIEPESESVKVPRKAAVRPVRTPIVSKTMSRLNIKSGRVKKGTAKNRR
jgi:hypothetical protein